MANGLPTTIEPLVRKTQKQIRDHESYMKHREARLTKMREYAQTHKEERNAKARERLSRQRDRINSYNRDYRKELRGEVLTAYGNKCSCCNEPEEAFLEVHHINGGGNTHRKELGGGAKIYGWLRRNGWPKDFALLCSNCNDAEFRRGICPHKLRKLEGGVN